MQTSTDASTFRDDFFEQGHAAANEEEIAVLSFILLVTYDDAQIIEWQNKLALKCAYIPLTWSVFSTEAEHIQRSIDQHKNNMH